MMISAVMQQFYGDNIVEEPSLDLMRHMTWKNLIFYRKKFRKEFGEVVICCDSKNVWRKEIFPYYKSKRKTAKKKSQFDWGFIYDSMDTIVEDTRANLPYITLKIDQLEADDIIAVICKNVRDEDHVIISTDEDYKQLQRYQGVNQYSPNKKKFLYSDNPEKELLEKIIRGDDGDGIPNVRSDSDTFVIEGKRQDVMSAKRLDELMTMGESGLEKSELWAKNFERNRMLIDFDMIPYAHQVKVMEVYKSTVPNSRKNLLGYFHKMKLAELSAMHFEF